MFVQRRRVPQVTARLNPCPQPWKAVSLEPVKSQRVWLLGRSNGTSAKYQANAFPFPAAFQTDDDGPLIGRPEAAGTSGRFLFGPEEFVGSVVPIVGEDGWTLTNAAGRILTIGLLSR